MKSFQLDITQLATGAWTYSTKKQTGKHLLNVGNQLYAFFKIKIVNKKSPLYLQSLLPHTIGDIRQNSRYLESFYC